MSLKWEDPPSPGHGNGVRISQWEATAAQLRANPKRWARIATYTYAHKSSGYTLAGTIRQGKVPVWAPAGAFESVTRADGKECHVYARYAGDDL